MKTLLQDTLPKDYQTIVDIVELLYPFRRIKDISVSLPYTWVCIRGRLVIGDILFGKDSKSELFDIRINNHHTKLWGKIDSNDYDCSWDIGMCTNSAYPASFQPNEQQINHIVKMLENRGYKLPNLKEFQKKYNED